MNIKRLFRRLLLPMGLLLSLGVFLSASTLLAPTSGTWAPAGNMAFGRAGAASAAWTAAAPSWWRVPPIALHCCRMAES